MRTIYGSMLHNVIINMVFTQVIRFNTVTGYPFQTDVEFECGEGDGLRDTYYPYSRSYHVRYNARNERWNNEFNTYGKHKDIFNDILGPFVHTMTPIYGILGGGGTGFVQNFGGASYLLKDWPSELFFYGAENFTSFNGITKQTVEENELKAENSDYYMNAQTIVAVKVDTNNGDTTMVHLDTVIVAQSQAMTTCDELNGKRKRGMSMTPDCRFNELVICSATGRKWHSMGMIGKGLDRNRFWLRQIHGGQYTFVNKMRYVRTRNSDITVTLAFGTRSDSCMVCTDYVEGVSQCPSDIVIHPNNWGELIFPEEHVVPYFEYVADTDISCIKIETGSSTCNLEHNLWFGHALVQSEKNQNPRNLRPWRKISLPMKVDWDGPCYDNVQSVSWGDLGDAPEILNCKNGFLPRQKKDINGDLIIFRCVPINSLICPGNGDVSSFFDCSNLEIYMQCHKIASAEATTGQTNYEEKYLESYKNCFKQAVLLCQGVKIALDEGQIGDCKSPCGNNLYWDMPSESCKPCSISTGSEKWDSYNHHELKCEGAYRGRKTCANETRYLKHPPEMEEARRDPYRSTPIALWETTDAFCEKCLETEVPSDNYVEEECHSDWSAKDGLLDSGPSMLSMCTNETCGAGEYIDCKKDWKRNGNCPSCSCSDDCTLNSQFCFVDTTICNGTTFTNEGGTCTYFDSITCPIGKYYSVPSGPPDLSAKTHYTMTEIMNAYCVDCEIENCYRTGGMRWPECLEAGLTANPVCVSCMEVENSDWYTIKENTNECLYECHDDFFDNGTACLTCKQPCDVGEYRPKCRGAATEPIFCASCKVLDRPLSNQCDIGSYKEQCDGTGYGNPGDDMCYNPCHDCQILNCSESEEFIQCTWPASNDTSKCVDCEAFDSEESDGVDDNSFGAACTFQCQKDYYKQKTDGQPKCVKCETNPSDFCNCGDNCDGFEVEQCDEKWKKEPPNCYCSPGFYNTGNDNDLICKKCPNFLYAGYVSTMQFKSCLTCPQGYTGNTEMGSTHCIPCPVNTYIGMHSGACKVCKYGTDGITGATSCQESCPDGLRGKLLQWTGVVRNYNVTGDEWVLWEGAPPNKCFMQGMDPDIQICDTGMGWESIEWKDSKIAEDSKSLDIHHLDHYWLCEMCANGLAYSSNFNWDEAFQ